MRVLLVVAETIIVSVIGTGGEIEMGIVRETGRGIETGTERGHTDRSGRMSRLNILIGMYLGSEITEGWRRWTGIREDGINNNNNSTFQTCLLGHN